MPVLRTEDLIGLKLQALRNDPAREAQDFADIRTLALANRETMDWTIVEGYFRLLGATSLLETLRKETA